MIAALAPAADEIQSLLPEHAGPAAELHQRGIDHIRRGEWYDAIRMLRRAEAAQPSPSVARALGFAYYGARQHVLFRLKMEEAIGRDRRHFAPYYFLGRHYGAEVGDWTRAAEYFRQSIERNADHAASHHYLGYALEMDKLTDAAETEYRRSLELARRSGGYFALPQAGLARLRLADGRAAEAAAQLEAALSLDPTDAGTAYQLYRAYAANGEIEKANRMLGGSPAAEVDLWRELNIHRLERLCLELLHFRVKLFYAAERREP
jgi:tetratricopeptide (TPR) repeat protein